MSGGTGLGSITVSGEVEVGARRIGSVCSAALMLVVLATSLVTSSAEAGSAAFLPGDPIDDGPVGVFAPLPGNGVHIVAYGTEGISSLGAETSVAGVVTVYDIGPDVGGGTAGASATATGTDNGCTDDAFNLHRWKWMNTFSWYFQRSSTPDEITQDNAESALKQATVNMTTADNCGMLDQVSATHSYDGSPPSGAGDNIIIAEENGVKRVKCAANEDAHSVSRFGDLPVKAEGGTKNFAGVTCTFYTVVDNAVDRAKTSDMRLNKEDYQWVVNIGQNCSNKLHVESVATHERGHTFGIRHVGEQNHGWLTMSESINAFCATSESTLGKGDILGLRQRY